MNAGRTVFSQLLAHVPSKEFQKCVTRYRGDANPRGFSCWDQYLAMAFAQLTYRESLRDIEACLRSVGSKLYHMGLRGKVARTTLADANERHDWRIYSDFAQMLISIARPLYSEDPPRRRLEEQPLRTGLHDHRPLSVVVPVGQVPPAQGCHQNAHAAGSARQHPHIYQHYRRQSARCQHPRRRFCQRPGRSTSWTAATSISSVSTGSR